MEKTINTNVSSGLEKKRTLISSKMVGYLTVGFSVVIIVMISWILYEHTVNLLTNNLRERLISIVSTAAVQFDSQDLNALQLADDSKKPVWSKVVNQLISIRLNNKDIVFSYILRKSNQDPNKMVFVADSHSLDPNAKIDLDKNGIIDDADALNWPGEEYADVPSESFDGYNGALTNKDLYEDQWGTLISGYAPIRDEMGNTVAVMTVDVRADDFLSITRQTFFPFIIFIIFLILVLIILTSILIKIWNKRIEIFAELDRQKDELLGIVAHQLGKPITAIRWNLESLLDGDLGQITDLQKKETKTMRTIAINLADLTSMILDVTRIQLGKMQLDPQALDMNVLFTEMIEVVKSTVTQKKLHFVIHLPEKMPTVLLDKRYTRMTIENLLTNAVKYTPEGGEVTLDVQIKDGVMHGSVSDTGCGIPKAEQDKIFGKMFRASNIRNTQEGNGFGLYVARGAIEGQGGKIWFESTEGKGTTFYFELPMQMAKTKK